ncbi:DUF5797 family protein [Halorientalis marina]|jgi:hypothetical protein|uniref:DUF5797 family protein n=1 Tax=Halorientalis marina TaxID=2931976 RepID=UPI001FF35643|nr:DUF5797 family protein [Halorientalis marina]
MTLSEEARERLADVVALQPTKNAELQDQWGMNSGSEVHGYLESELSDYYYRDDDSLICATDEAAALVGAETETDDGERIVRVPVLQAAVLGVVAGPDEDSESVVSVLQKLREAGHDPAVEDVRSALRNLSNKGLIETVQRTVPTFRLALDRDEFVVEEMD